MYIPTSGLFNNSNFGDIRDIVMYMGEKSRILDFSVFRTLAVSVPETLTSFMSPSLFILLYNHVIQFESSTHFQLRCFSNYYYFAMIGCSCVVGMMGCEAG